LRLAFVRLGLHQKLLCLVFVRLGPCEKLLRPLLARLAAVAASASC